jgi:hypothetical protein
LRACVEDSVIWRLRCPLDGVGSWKIVKLLATLSIECNNHT